jgi:hypothetical protein
MQMQERRYFTVGHNSSNRIALVIELKIHVLSLRILNGGGDEEGLRKKKKKKKCERGEGAYKAG